MKTQRYSFLGLLITAVALSSGCGKNSTSATEDASSSGVAAELVGGTVKDSSSATASVAQQNDPNLRSQPSIWSAIGIPKAYAGTACPTFASSSGAGCSVSASTMTLTYSQCSFGSSTAVWNGSQEITLSSGSPACGQWPATGFTGTLTRTFGGTIAGGDETTRTASTGTVVELDTSSNLSNYTDATGIGGGVEVTFSSGARTQINVKGIRLLSPRRFDHTVTTTTPLTITDSSSSKVVNGTLAVYHNLEKVTGASTFNAVTFSATCCTPVSGSITTAFTAGTNGNSHSRFVGKSETLTFTGCGTATYQGVDGSTADVTLSHCF